MCKSDRKTGDYHNDMNASNYQIWPTEKLILNLTPKLALVIDNAPYHNVQLNRALTSNSKKSVMKELLMANQVPFDDDMLKVQLYNLVKDYKPVRICLKWTVYWLQMGLPITPPAHPRTH